MHASESTRATCERCAVHRGEAWEAQGGRSKLQTRTTPYSKIGSDRGRGTHVREQRSGMVRCRACNRKASHAV